MSFRWGKWSDKALYSILKSNAFINLWEGAVSSGKTIASLFRLAEATRKNPPGPLLFSGKSSTTIKHNVLNVLQDMFPEYIKFNSEEGKFFGREFHIVGAYDERSEQKIRGGSYVLAYCDEWTLYPKSYTDMLISRLRLDGAMMFATTNPDSPYHYLKTDYIDRVNELDMKIFSFKLTDNPNLSIDYIKRVMSIYTGLFYKRFIDGLWVLADGLVYDCFDPNIHIIGDDQIPYKDDVKFKALSGDYGTMNPTGFLKWYVTYKNICYIVDEYYYEGRNQIRLKTSDDYVKDLIEFTRDEKYKGYYFDPSAAPLHASLDKFKLGHMKMKVNNEVLEGIATVGRKLKNNEIFVHKKCVNYIKEKGSYSWDKKASIKSGEDKVFKMYDHLQDAERYFIHTEFGKAYDNLRGWK